jgi:hypothetical protein
MKIIRICLSLLFIISCSKNEKLKISEIKGFPIEKSIDHINIKTPPVLFNVGQLLLIDSILVTFDLKADTIIRAFLLPNFKYLGALIKRGRGPGEEIFVDPFVSPLTDRSFLYKSSTNIKIAKIELDNLNLKIESNEIKLPGSLINFQHLFKLNDSLTYGWDPSQEGVKEFISYDHKTNNVKAFGPDYPRIIKNVPSKFRPTLFSKIITVKPDKKSFASVYEKFKILRIYNFDGSVKKEVQFLNSVRFPKEIVENHFKNVDPKRLMIHYQKIKSTNNFIYALYSGRPLSIIPRDQRSMPNICNEIHVWNWDGDPICKLILDKDIASFEISKDDSYIIGYSLFELDILYKYNLNILKVEE